MVFSAENSKFTFAVKEMGAELTSLKSKTTGIEYIWCGNTDIWYGQSPILFPIIGRLLDDKYTWDGTEYSMEKHGIVRKRPFTLVKKTEDSLIFVFNDDDETWKSYPCNFELTVEFKLTENGLKVTHTVSNLTDDVMYFSFGAHPGFNCEIGDYLEFNNDTSLVTERIDHESILIDETFPVAMDGNKIELTKDLFIDDALILSKFNSNSVSIKSKSHNRVVKFDFNSPFLGIWAKPNAPYVCLEPWWGVNDSYHKVSDISEKRGIIALDAYKSMDFTWEVSICE